MNPHNISIPAETKAVSISFAEPYELLIKQKAGSEAEISFTGVPVENIKHSAEADKFSLEIFGDVDLDDAEILICSPEPIPLTVTTGSGVIILEEILSDLEATSTSGAVCLSGFSGKSAQINVESGDVTVDESSGNIGISVSSGDAVVTEFEGNLVCKVDSGDVTLSEVSGDIEISSRSGDIEAGSVMGNLSFSAVSGDILIGDVTVEKLNAQTVSGDIEIEAEVLEEESVIQVKSVSGSIILVLPEDVDGKIRATVKSGEIVLDTDPYKLDIGGENKETTVSIVLTESEEIALPEITLETSSGDIEISA
ncbi:MAG: DUF4097 family beta strand repeat-containing protein [Firmicutes bacterium]|nr:DUF4097 family beta strand repeat-containing protein [Bacillota bacterium]